MILGILSSEKHYKGPRKDITGSKCSPKLNTGNVKSVNVQETQYHRKEPCSSPSLACRRRELVTMDIVEYAQSSRGYHYCLVRVDHFIKLLELFPVRHQKAESIAKKVSHG